ncbi:type VII secretion system-associated protein [Streptomyces sp. NPDC051636]|uniref:type VII secretion system-associated protein n=1 Tax=Streptomyces sp. NPDC051636 TaxID=3365663 RepID=UPI0037B6087D
MTDEPTPTSTAPDEYRPEEPVSQSHIQGIPAAPVGARRDERGAAGGDGVRTDAATTGPDAGPPPIPDEIREAGRLAPDHWLGMVDPTWSGEGPPPEWAVVGQWRSGLDGEIEEWRDNPEYRPSPSALGWPEPEDEVDRAIQLAATGYGPGEGVGEALVDREVAVFAKPGGGLLSAAAPDGKAVVPLFTSPVFLHTAGRLAFELVNANDLIDQVPEGHLLYLNPSAAVSMTLELGALRSAIESAGSSVPSAPSAPSAPSVPTVSRDVEPEAQATPSTEGTEPTTEGTDESERTDKSEGTEETDESEDTEGTDESEGTDGSQQAEGADGTDGAGDTVGTGSTDVLSVLAGSDQPRRTDG